MAGTKDVKGPDGFSLIHPVKSCEGSPPKLGEIDPHDIPCIVRCSYQLSEILPAAVDGLP